MKILSILFCIMLSVTANAQQIFSHITKLDKFDDVVWEKNLKTIITFNDSIITIETKGQDPECYFYKDNGALSFHSGTQESLVNLVDDIWGYEDVYYVVKSSEKEKFLKDLQVFGEKAANIHKECTSDSIFDKEKLATRMAKETVKFQDQMVCVTFRYISNVHNMWDYKTKLVWVKFPNGDRIIYECPNERYSSSRQASQFNSDVNSDMIKAFDVVQYMPEYPGGMGAMMQYLAHNLKYPQKAQKYGIQGRVVVDFIIEEDGTVSHPTVVRSVHPELDKEAIRVVSAMPKWIPGKQGETAVCVKLSCPISFRLQ